MKVDNRIDTTLRLELKSTLEKDGKRYLVVTDNHGTHKCDITTRVFMGTEPVMKKSETLDAPDDPLDAEALKQMLGRQHDEVLSRIAGHHVISAFKSSKDLMDWVRELMRNHKRRKAYEVLRDAVEYYSDDPHVLTYYGSLAALIGGEHVRGMEACRRAVDIMRGRGTLSERESMPFFYLNLSRACMAGGCRKEAVDALYEGQTCERKGGPIHRELMKLGVRRRPIFPFLDRSNPFNKYLGMFFFGKLGLGANRRLAVL